MSYKLLLVDVQRQLELTLLAVLGRHIRVLPLPEKKITPTVKLGVIYLPEFIEMNSKHSAQNFFLSAALHAAAHLIYSKPTDSKGLNNRQMVLCSVIEDARIERLACIDFPGMQRLFKSHFTRLPTSSMVFDEIAYAIAYALASETEDKIDTSNSLVLKAITMFQHAILEDASDREPFKNIGLALANDLGQLRISMNEKEDFVLLNYRDDNAFLWNQLEEVGSETETSDETDNSQNVSATGVGYDEVLDGQSVFAFGQSALQQEGLVFKAVKENAESNLLNRPNIESDYEYPEWDYKIARWKQKWCSLNEYLFTEVKSKSIDDRMDKYQGFIQKLQQMINRYQFKVQRQKKQEDGNELDLEAIIQYTVDHKAGSVGTESKIYIGNAQEKPHGLALLVLIDLSESMNDLDSDEKNTILDLTLDSTIVLSKLLNGLGHSYAIHGFNSNTREDISYFNIKDFDQSSEDSLHSLSQIKAAYSTRLGAALRHAFYKISKRQERHKLILVITDGEPSDIDIYDDQYLIEDAAIAVKEIESSACKTFCLSLDKNADKYVQKIFRKGQFEVLEQPNKLPQVLTRLYLKLFSRVTLNIF